MPSKSAVEETQGRSGDGRLVLSDTAPLHPGSLFSLDGRDALVGPRFRGVRDITPGWHAVGWSASASPSSGGTSASTAEVSSLDAGVRNVLLLRWEAGQAITFEYEAQSDALRPVSLSRGTDIMIRRDTAAPEQHLVPYPIPSDPASYAQSNRRIKEIDEDDEDRIFASSWTASVANLGALPTAQADALVARIFNAASSGLWTDSLADVRALAPLIAQPDPAADAETAQPQRDVHGRAYWGAERDVTPLPEGTPVQNEAEPVSLLHFTAFDLKRSWPKDSNGTQRTRWSVDKSWLLEEVVGRAGGACRPTVHVHRASLTSQPISRSAGEPNLLAELDILFLLFRTAHNGPCLDRWRQLVSLFCRSGERLGAPGSFELHPAVQQLLGSEAVSTPRPTPLNTDSTIITEADRKRTLPRLDSLHATFLRTLRAHLALLPRDFFQADPEGARLEMFLLDELAVLKSHLGACLSRLAVDKTGSRAGDGDGGEDERQERTSASSPAPRPELLLPAYRALTHLTRSRFGWDLEGPKGEEELAMRDAGIWVSGKGKMREGVGGSYSGGYDSDEEAGEAGEEEDEEDEEDRPVVVPFEEVEAATLRTS